MYKQCKLKPENYSVCCCVRLNFALSPPLYICFFINDITKCSQQFKCILFSNNSALSTKGDNVIYSADLINNELTCLRLNRWLKSNTIYINADKSKYKLFMLKK